MSTRGVDTGVYLAHGCGIVRALVNRTYMNTVTKAVAGAALALSVSFAFAQAASLTSDQITAIMNLLQSFGADQSVINNVQASLTGGTPSGGHMGDDHRMGSTTPWMNGMGSSTPPMGGMGDKGRCLAIGRNLGLGAQGDDVKGLQQLLSDDGMFMGSTTGFFGQMTQKALAMWQEHNGIASSTTGGSVGPMTRMFLQHRCGQGGMMGSTTPGMPPRDH